MPTEKSITGSEVSNMKAAIKIIMFALGLSGTAAALVLLYLLRGSAAIIGIVKN